MRQRNTARRSREKGSAFVESALVLLPLITVMIAVLDFGQMLFVHQSLVEATRKAARYGIVTAYDADAIRNIVIYDNPTPAADARPRFNLDASMVTVSRYNAGATSDRIEVKLSNYPFEVYSPLIAATLRGMTITTTLPYEGS